MVSGFVQVDSHKYLPVIFDKDVKTKSVRAKMLERKMNMPYGFVDAVMVDSSREYFDMLVGGTGPVPAGTDLDKAYVGFYYEIEDELKEHGLPSGSFVFFILEGFKDRLDRITQLRSFAVFLQDENLMKLADAIEKVEQIRQDRIDRGESSADLDDKDAAAIEEAARVIEALRGKEIKGENG
jgi:hypothetical protein